MSKECYVMVERFQVKDIRDKFFIDPYGSVAKYIKHNIAFEKIDAGVQKALISAFGYFLFSFEKFEAADEGLILDGCLVSHKFIYDFITISDDAYLEELLRLHKKRACPKAFVRNMNSLLAGV